jgi:hypothetical protein
VGEALEQTSETNLQPNNKNMKTTAAQVILTFLMLGAGRLSGQTAATNAPPATNSPPPVAAAETDQEWSFSLSAYTYVVPDGPTYVQPTLTADRGRLHLEARYNYEALETASIWGGYKFSGGEKLAWEITPMLGGVFGKTSGIAPGYKGSLTWWKLELYSEGEYLASTGDSSDSFFYNWSELTLAPVDWFRFGLVTQRTHAYQTDREIQRGVLAGFSFKRVDVTAYVFNPDESKPTVVVSVGVGF